MRARRLSFLSREGNEDINLLEHIAAFLSSRGGVMSPVALRFHDSAIPTPQSSGRRARSALFLGVMVFRAGLQARATRFFVLLLVVHIIPL